MSKSHQPMYPVHARPCDATTVESQFINPFLLIQKGDTMVVIERLSGMVIPRMFVVSSEPVVLRDDDGAEVAIEFEDQQGYKRHIMRHSYVEIFVKPSDTDRED